jgi:hypothetical protein
MREKLLASAVVVSIKFPYGYSETWLSAVCDGDVWQFGGRWYVYSTVVINGRGDIELCEILGQCEILVL